IKYLFSKPNLVVHETSLYSPPKTTSYQVLSVFTSSQTFGIASHSLGLLKVTSKGPTFFKVRITSKPSFLGIMLVVP
ncbi:hypothetical protein, partial [Acinetobacter guillouiae]|uniref:hypothetical protein n=1 Tax=Acinetobacter guillouiae TaxID=106649 RepID=UPI002FDAB527